MGSRCFTPSHCFSTTKAGDLSNYESWEVLFLFALAFSPSSTRFCGAVWSNIDPFMTSYAGTTAFRNELEKTYNCTITPHIYTKLLRNQRAVDVLTHGQAYFQFSALD